MKNKIAMTTIIGISGGIACVALAIAEGGNLSLFINVPSLLMIVGGTAFALVASFPSSTLKTLGSVMVQAFNQKTHDLIEDINTIIQLSQIGRKEGLLAIESHIEDSDDLFLKKGLNMMIDGATPEDLEALMVGEIYQASRRHNDGVDMVKMIASLAPSLGLVGTYVGLIPMLVDLTDPDKLGPMMAIELVSSFYGGLIAYVVFSPLAKKLEQKSAQEKIRKELILEGILAIQDGKNPRLIIEMLSTYLTEEEKQNIPPINQSSINQDSSSENVIELEQKQRRAN